MSMDFFLYDLMLYTVSEMHIVARKSIGNAPIVANIAESLRMCIVKPMTVNDITAKTAKTFAANALAFNDACSGLNIFSFFSMSSN